MNLFSLTRELIDIPSLTGDELAVGQYLSNYLERLGYRVEKQGVAADRFNVLATTEAPSRIVFSTHMDTVPPFMASSEDEEFIYGRGSCDAKGIIAVQIFAAERLRASGVNDLGLLFTVDEELSSFGAQAANKHPQARQCQFLINGEPTDNRLATGTKGSVRVFITTDGRAAHSAYPEAGESAIEKLLDILQDIRSCRWPEDGFFGTTTCNIGVLNGGTRPNVIPDHARAELQIRLGIDIEHVKRVLEDAVGTRGRLEYASAHNPVRLFSVPGIDECVVRFTTDVPYLSQWGKPLLLGPGSILDAHTDHERVSKRELEDAVELYVKLAEKL
ncbi:MAG TPA: M20/M25/M40 family metallo-hydrolase [Pyrinomonadaceae bacterium]|jgi:acetylornithine deacetylase|nr:M20/M25/M40 family metallo-hydrolase [Pyrinomonadaceae bacterium]